MNSSVHAFQYFSQDTSSGYVMERKRKKTFDHSYSFIPIEFALELVLATHFSYLDTFTQGLNILLNFLCIFILYMLYLVGYLFAYVSEYHILNH